MHKTLREKIRFYLVDGETNIGKSIDFFIIALNVLIISIFVLSTFPGMQKYANILWAIEVIIVLFFIVEYFSRLYGAKNRWRQFIRIYMVIDIIAILPTVLLILFNDAFFNLGFLMIARIFRVFRFIRFTRDQDFFFGRISMQHLRVIRLLFTIFMIFFVGAGLFWFVESPVNDNVRHFGDAFYFTVVTLTTVGFGDIAPVSEQGRLVTTLMIITGILLIPWQAGQVIREWFRIGNKRRVVCHHCGLRFHDKDASHCKACGHVIYQEHDGD